MTASVQTPKVAKAPAPSWLEIISGIKKVQDSPFEALRDIHGRFGDVVRISLPTTSHIICHPDHLQHVFMDNSQNYLKRGQDFFEVQSFMGDGILLSEGHKWRSHRKIVLKELQTFKLLQHIPMICEEAERFVKKMATESSAVHNLWSEIMDLNLAIASRLMLGEQLEGKAVLHKAIAVNSTLVSKRMRQLVRVPRNFPLPSHVKADRAIRDLDKLLYGLIKDSKGSQNCKTNLMSNLINCKKTDENSRKKAKIHLDELEIRDEIATLLITGHETISSMVSWAIYLLARNPKYLKLLRAELDDKPREQQLDLGSLESLYWPKKILQETLRMYPPLASLSKEAKEKDKIGGFDIPAGSLIHVCVYLAHHHPDFWDLPDSFLPERFDEKKQRHPCAYVPFGRGARSCIGADLAMLQGQLILCEVARKLDFDIGHHDATARVTTVPKKPFLIKFRRRKSSL